MAANTNVLIPAFRQAASGSHHFAVSGPVPVCRGNRDVTVTLGSIWSYVTPCRLSDMVTPVPNILAYNIEFFLSDLNNNTLIYFDSSSPYLTVTDTIDARVQVFIPPSVQLNVAALVPGNYFHMLRITAPDGTVTVQTKGRFLVNPIATALPVPVDNDPYALSPNAEVTTLATDTTGTITSAQYTFDTPSILWVVTHNLGSYPAIITTDPNGLRMYGEENYIDGNNVTIAWANPTSGVTYLN